MDINNSITEDYCSFEVSKLLREKEFESVCNSYYNSHLVKEEMGYANYNRISNLEVYSRPTHALAIKWIRWNFRIDISVHKSTSGKSVSEIWRINPEPNKGWIRERTEYGEETHYKATEKALLYVLNNMLK